MNIKKIFFLFSLVFIRYPFCYSYVLPQTFREWTPIGINNQIDKTKPYFFNLGNMPMLLWYNKNQVPNVMINTCKHLGNSLSDSYIDKNNCLICPHHKTAYNENDNMGSTVINNQDGLIWWSYKSYTKTPFKFSSVCYNDYYNSYIDVNVDIISCVLNLIADFNYDTYKTSRHGMKFLFKDKKNNRLLFLYPYTIIIKNDDYYYKYGISPIGVYNSRIFISSNNKKGFDNYLNLEKKTNFFPFKLRMAFTNDNKKKAEEQIFNLYMNKYMIIDDNTIHHFLMNRKYY